MISKKTMLFLMTIVACFQLNAVDIIIKLNSGQELTFPADLIDSIDINVQENEIIKEENTLLYNYSFSQESSLNRWKTDWIWEKNNQKNKGSVSWSSEYGGTAKVRVNGAPCVIDFWTNLERDLKFGDEIQIIFYCKQSLEPISGVTLTIGPTIPYGHKQSIGIASTKGGEIFASMPIWSSPYTKGTPFGITFAVWPGESIIYIKEINLIRKQ